jgi:hypothetical protein
MARTLKGDPGPASFAGEQPLGMCSAVLRRHVTVLGIRQHLAVLVDHGTEGMVALGHRATRHLERAAAAYVSSAAFFVVRKGSAIWNILVSSHSWRLPGPKEAAKVERQLSS